jgi:3-oxoacyl-[acyl-carrier protein] reductase
MADLDGKVAIVTGAAHGLGRIHALNLARLGARVVVNDLGTKADGSGRDEAPARAVVEEIRRLGGEAVAHFGDAADWNDAQALVGTALASFGDLHVLVNNAGFARDATLFNMSEQDFDAVVRVHLKGHFCPTKFACIHWRERSKATGGPVYGRVISTASEAALFCPPGQPNYGPAKAGVVSLTMGVAQLMLKYGVTANVVMPRARTRMTLSGPTEAMFQKPEQGFDQFAPDNVSPLFCYLASPRAERISGQVFIVWGRRVQVIGRPRIDAAGFDCDETWNVDGLHEKLGPYFEKLQPVTDGYSVPIG